MLSAISRFFARHGSWVNPLVTLLGIVAGGSLPSVHFGDVYLEYYATSVPVTVLPAYEPPASEGPPGYFPYDHATEHDGYTAHPTKAEGVYGHVFVLSDDFCWLYEADGGDSAEPQVELVGRPQDPEAVPRFLQKPALQEQLRLSTDVIAVGVASCEGNEDDETDRAGRRSEMLAYWLRGVKPSQDEDSLPRIHRLNLGQHRGCPAGAAEVTTRRQRPVLFIALIREPGVELGDHDLMLVLKQAEELDIDLGRYTGFLA